ncbi:MAG: ABC transporter permease, partial [Spirochaetales bacterium]|nr:ABC transporter permease [Spirochaetales bacterium]
MGLFGNNPFSGYFYLFRGGLMSIERIGNTLASATPLMLTGLSVAFAFKTGLFNIGAAGQMLMGGLFATAIALTLNFSKPIMLSIIILSSIVGGGVWGFLPGLLKAKFNVHEVVSTIMMNWIAYWLVYYTVPAYFKGQTLETESRLIPYYSSLKVDWLTNMFHGSYLNLGFFIAIAVIIIISIILNRTVLGFDMKAAGFNRDAALSSGINVNKNIVLSMVIAGGLSGLAGATYYVGYASNMQI